MAHRSPARWLAPLALVAAALAIVFVAAGSGGDGDSGPPAPAAVSEPTSTNGARKRTPTAAKTSTTPKRTASSSKIYTVQPGDILSTVAEKTGVPVDRLRELNPELDANSMSVGQKIRLDDDAPQTP
jgi:LysM repeat protein